MRDQFLVTTIILHAGILSCMQVHLKTRCPVHFIIRDNGFAAYRLPNHLSAIYVIANRKWHHEIVTSAKIYHYSNACTLALIFKPKLLSYTIVTYVYITMYIYSKVAGLLSYPVFSICFVMCMPTVITTELFLVSNMCTTK